MIPHRSRWALVTLTSALLALAACAGSNWPTVPNAQGSSQAASVGADNVDQPSVAILGAHPNEACPKRFIQCFTVSKKKGALLVWCYGPKSDPCSKSDSSKVTWSGVVCLAKGKTCKGPITQLTAAWTGPFKCEKKDKCKGKFELDTITPGSGLSQTQAYDYKQDIHICAGAKCEDVYVGMNVSS